MLDSQNPTKAGIVHSHTYGVHSDSLYRLQLFDPGRWGGTFCWDGQSWFTITANPFDEHAEGSIVWEARGDALENSLDVFVWVDSNGHVHHIEHFPGEGYGLVQQGSLDPDPWSGKASSNIFFLSIIKKFLIVTK